MHLAHEEHEYGNNDENRETGNQQLCPNALLLRLSTLNLHAVGQQIIHQLRVFDHGSNGFEVRAIITFCTDRESVNNHFANSIVVNFLDKAGISNLLGSALHTEVVEYREQDRGNNEP